MAKLDALGTVLEFLKGLQLKVAAQIAKKALSLNIDPLPNDSKRLKGYPKFLSSGYWRISYSLSVYSRRRFSRNYFSW